MKQYYDKESTPLAFHKFFWFISLPIGFVVSIIRAASELSGILYFNWLYAVDIMYYAISMTLMFACFVGFFRWKPYAWHGIITLFSIGVLYNIYVIICWALYLPDYIGTALGEFLGIVIFYVLAGIYYIKRRPLFFLDTLEAQSMEDRYDLTGTKQDDAFIYDTSPSIKYCHKCGYALLPESDFCSKCGAAVAIK